MIKCENTEWLIIALCNEMLNQHLRIKRIISLITFMAPIRSNNIQNNLRFNIAVTIDPIHFQVLKIINAAFIVIKQINEDFKNHLMQICTEVETYRKISGFLYLLWVLHIK